MSEHDELADRREAEADKLAREGERNEERAEEARNALEHAQRDELTPAAMGEDDPAHRAPTEAEREEDEAAANAPPPPKTPGEKVEASLAASSAAASAADDTEEDEPPPSEEDDDPARPRA